MPAPFLTVANLLSLVRLPMAAAVWIDPDEPALLLPLVAAAAITDLLDGWTARRRGDTTEVGAWLDPLCDKAFAVSVLVALLVTGRLEVGLFVLIALREFLIAPLALAYRLLPPRVRGAMVFRARWPGKICTVSQFAAILAALFVPWLALPAAVLAAVLGVVAVADYVDRGVRLVLLAPTRDQKVH